MTWLSQGEGAPGVDGKMLRSGSGVPSNGLGIDGDFYIDTVTKKLYGPKAAGAYPAGSLIGLPQDGDEGDVLTMVGGVPTWVAP